MAHTWHHGRREKTKRFGERLCRPRKHGGDTMQERRAMLNYE